ncbi:MAG: AAA family ATPase, partial [Duncaniella sp.]|nr:AAA family ATPase [Duncaniella sp.]
MKLSSIDIANFRGFERFSLNLTEGVNVLIGRNGSGKTTVIDAVR